MGVFDSFGAGFEYTDRDFIREHNDPATGYRQHPKWVNLKPGCYSDDTQMALALADLMLDEPDVDAWTYPQLTEYFLRAFRRDPREGYAQNFWDLLKTCAAKDLDEGPRLLLATLRPHSRKNGGAMRAGILGILPDERLVADRAMFQAAWTHATQEGLMAAAASALMVHYFHYDLGSVVDLPKYLDEQVPLPKYLDIPGSSWTYPWSGKVRAPGLEAVRAAVRAIEMALVRKDSGQVRLSETRVLKNCVAFGGDTDTVAAIAGMAISHSKEVEADLPKILWEGLENGTYGRDYLIGLDAKLMEQYPAELSAKRQATVVLEPVGSLFD